MTYQGLKKASFDINNSNENAGQTDNMQMRK